LRQPSYARKLAGFLDDGVFEKADGIRARGTQPPRKSA
jgi:hypothetical protein